MGSFASKLMQNTAEKSSVEEKMEDDSDNNLEGRGSNPSTPILTPKAFRNITEKNNLDPRSPSKHIARTPIEILSATTQKLKILALNNAETPLKNHVFLGIDPRSPAIDFQRTPIIVSSSSPANNLPEKLRNKNLDKVRKCTLPNTPNNKVLTPKLLESSPITPKPTSDPYKRKSFVLLETNIDFTETDLDTVIKEKYLGKSTQDLNATSNEICDPRSPTTDFLRTPIQICQKMEYQENISIQTIEECVEQNEKKDLIEEEKDELNENQTAETFMDIIKLSSSPNRLEPDSSIIEEKNIENILVIEVNDQSSKESESEDCDKGQQPLDISENPLINNTAVIKKEDTIIITPNKRATDEGIVVSQPIQSPNLQLENKLPKSAPVSPHNNVIFTPKKPKSQPVTPPFIDLTADVKELDKKLTHLIYQDEEDLVVCPRIVKVKDQSRTPLGLRNGNGHDNKKSTQKLKVSDKPRKAEYAVSKIPVFKEKKIKVQCENTPPRGLKPKKSQWDAKDDTLVI